MKCSNKNQNRGISLTTHIPISSYHVSEKCASDIENFAWNRKICSKSYIHARDGAGEIVNLRNGNVTHTRPSQEKNKHWFLEVNTLPMFAAFDVAVNGTLANTIRDELDRI